MGEYCRSLTLSDGSKNWQLITGRWFSEPVASVGDPPAQPDDGNSGGQRPPEGKNHVGDEAEHNEADPENFALHALIVALGFPFLTQTYTNVP